MMRSELSALPARVDLLIIGGGISGAGVFREASRTGARVLLVEQGDYASGTSSASSKLVHGGLRYLKTGEWRLTLESVRERQRLLEEAGGLVEPQRFLLPVYRGARPGRHVLRLGLFIYDLMAGSRRSRWLSAAELHGLEPDLRGEGLLGGLQYEDARTDDARLSLRLILDAVAEGGMARNYTEAVQLLRSREGRVCGAVLRDAVSGQTREIQARVVVVAAGAAAGRLGGPASGAPTLRPLRGSHLLFAPARLPLRHAVSWLHPVDRRPVFAYPWEGAVLLGTTDLDHGDMPATSATMSAEERTYLEEALAHQFPHLGLRTEHALSSYAGVRPVVAGGKATPSAESRESAMWTAPGLVGITGGKLTTFRVTARQVLEEAAQQWQRLAPRPEQPVFVPPPGSGLDRRLHGRLGPLAARYRETMPLAEQVPVGDDFGEQAELRWALRHEQVVHLDDVLLRRTRLGLTAPDRVRALLPYLQQACEQELGWSAERWSTELARYRQLWAQRHAPIPRP